MRCIPPDYPRLPCEPRVCRELYRSAPQLLCQSASSGVGTIVKSPAKVGTSCLAHPLVNLATRERLSL